MTVVTSPRSRRMSGVAKRALLALARPWRAAVLLVALIGVWELYVDLGGADPLILPAPHSVATAMYDDRGLLWSNFLVTAEEVMLGILVAAVAAMLLATAMHFFANVRGAVYPLLIASQTIPIPMLAPVLVLWLGFGMLPKLIVIALVSFFSIVITTLAGFASVDPELLKLVRTFDMSRRRTFFSVELPTALPGCLHRRQDRGDLRRDRSRVRRAGRRQLRLGLRVHPGDPATADRAGVRGRGDPVVVRDRAVLRVDAGRAAGRAVGPYHRLTDWRDGPMRKTIALLIGAAAAVLLTACGAKHDQIQPIAGKTQNVTMMLDWLPNADHVGIYEAIANGDLRDAGINLHVETPPSPSAPLSLVEAGKVDVAVSYEPEVMLARDQKQTILSFAALVQRPLTSLISIGSKHITRISQLRGKTVGTAGIPYQTAYLDTMLEPRRGRAQFGQAGRRRRQPRPRDDRRTGRRDARRLLELRGDRAAPSAQEAQRDPGLGGRRSLLRRARAGHFREILRRTT